MTLTRLLALSFLLLGMNAQAATDTSVTSQEKFIGQNLVQTEDATTKVVPTNKCLPKGKALEAVRVRVLREATKIDSVKLAYGNGVFDEIHVRESLDKGQSTEWIGLKTGMQCLERVDVAVVDTRVDAPTGAQDAPLLQVWGRVDDQVK